MLPLNYVRAPGPKSTVIKAKNWLGRPSVRLFSLFLAFATTVWLLGPFIVHFGGSIHLYEFWKNYSFPEGSHHSEQPISLAPEPPELWNSRAIRVREAFMHAYSGYKHFASGYDELLPISGGKVNNFNGWGVSMIDSLDTMWIMGLHQEFTDAMGIIAKQKFILADTNYAPFFETVIRYLGGLLSAYALSGETMLLARADDLGRMLLPAFNSPSGLPRYAVNPQTGDASVGWPGGPVILSEISSCQMEYKYLAHLTGRAEYYHKVENVMTKMYDANVTDGLFPTRWNPDRGTPMNSHHSVGASADSGYEYLLKQWLLSGQSETKARDQYIKSANGILNNLLFLSPNRRLLYVTDINGGRPSHILEHLSCFLPGLLALGAQTLELPPRDKELHQWAAEGLANTCWTTYADQETGLGPDGAIFNSSSKRWMEHVESWEAEGRVGDTPPGLQEVTRQTDGSRDYSNAQPLYLLRPETVESFFVLWKTTGDVRWRERGWAIFEALEKYSRTKYGYANVGAIDHWPPENKDNMPSYFLAETLKYLYLLFIDTDVIPLDKWVFNTEAHPLPVFNWTDWEKQEYNIP